MDRFIGYQELYKPLVIKDLKSNMDRFIEYEPFTANVPTEDLKSNMDRFIENFCSTISSGKFI